jgi:two-component system sensor histidine kinase KdpD
MARARWRPLEPRVLLMLNRLWARLAAERLRPLHCVYGLALVGLVTAVGEVVSPPYLKPTHLALMDLLAVLVVAIRWGLWPALLAAAVSVAALDYLFLPPLYSFEVDTPQDAILLAFLSIGAIIASGLAARLRDQVLIAERNAETTAALYRFAGKLAGTLNLDAAVTAAVEQVTAMLPYRASIHFPGESPPPAALTLPLRAADESVGLMALTPTDDGETTGEQRLLLEALAELAGIAIGRQILADRLAQLGIEQAAERLRSALLHSIAHDLTAPIASVATALASLKSEYDSFDDTTRRDLIAEAEREAERLHQFTANLVHMTRLEAGVIELRREKTDIGDLAGSALVRARPLLGSRRIVVDIPPGLPQPELDFALIEQAIFNLLENAGKYTPADATITIAAELLAGRIALKIGDDGPGFPAGDSERIFTKFYRASAAEGNIGTGLGLAICRGFIEAHGGTITARNRTDPSGALFTISLPLRAPALAAPPLAEPLPKV